MHPNYPPPPVNLFHLFCGALLALFLFPGRLLERGIVHCWGAVLEDFNDYCGLNQLTILDRSSFRCGLFSVNCSFLRLSGYDGLLVHLQVDSPDHWARGFDHVGWIGDYSPFDDCEEEVATWIGLPSLPIPVASLHSRLLSRPFPPFVIEAVVKQVEGTVETLMSEK